MLHKIILILLLHLSFNGVSRTFTVTTHLDTGQNSIRALLDSTVNGDTIKFGPATNKKPILLDHGQLVVFRSITIIGNDSSNTLLNGNAKIRIFEIVQSAVVKIFNLSIYNGNKTSGGSGVLNSGTLELNGCHVYRNTAIYPNSHVYGGGIFNYGKLYIFNSNVSHNVVYSASHTAFGAGVYNNVNGVCYINNSQITNNFVNGPNAYGGGFYNLGFLQCTNSNIEFNYCYSLSYSQGGGFSNEKFATCEMSKTKVYGNTARSTFSFSLAYGGGMYNNGTLTLGEVNVDSNTCNSTFKSMGAGLCADQGTNNTVVNSTFKGNGAYSDEESLGGGVYNYGTMELYNSEITGNVSQGLTTVSGGGIYNSNYAKQTLVNSTISGNRSNTGGGIFNHNNSNIILHNSIVWNNLGSVSNNEMIVKGASTLVKSLVKGLSSGGFTGAEDPSFIDSLSPYKAPSMGGDFGLVCSSVLVDAGIDSLNKTLYDLGNSARKIGAKIDVGAWEVNNKKDTSKVNRVECDSFIYLGKSISKSGEYVFVLSNSSGCDSVILLQAAITYVNTDIFLAGNTVIVDMFGANQQWLRCDKNYEVIPGATMQSYTATEDGEYAAEITLNGCKDTSLCIKVNFKGLDESNISQILIYPNPTNGEINIQLPENTSVRKLELINSLGQTIEERTTALKSNIKWKVNQKAGVYTLRLVMENGKVVRRKMIINY